jgi:hypothetical protein
MFALLQFELCQEVSMGLHPCSGIQLEEQTPSNKRCGQEGRRQTEKGETTLTRT